MQQLNLLQQTLAMGILKDIKQTKPISNKQKVLINIYYTYNWLRDQQSPLFKKHQLQQQHFNVLKIIKGRSPDPICPGEIKEVMLDKGRDLTRLLDKLERMKLVSRQLSKSNRRKVEVCITEKGIELTKVMELELFSAVKDIDITEEDAGILSDLLDKMR